MRTLVWNGLILAFVAVASSALNAQNTQATDPQILQLQQELSELRSMVGHSVQPAAFEMSPFVGCDDGYCGSSTCSSQRTAIFEAGAEFLFAKPHMKESFETTVTNVATGQLQMVPFDFDYDLAPRFWGQINTELGMGIRGTYWNYDESSNPTSATAAFPTFPGATAVTVIFPAAISTTAPGDLLNAGTSLDVQTLDLEGTHQFFLSRAKITGGAGLRGAEMDQRFRGTVSQGGIVIQSLDWSRQFKGLGPTVSGDVRVPVGNSGLSFISNLRGSLLFGEKTISRSVIGDVTPPPATTPPFVSLTNADEVSGIFELALGVEYAREVGQWGNLFVRGMYEGQLWTAAGAPTLTFLERFPLRSLQIPTRLEEVDAGLGGDGLLDVSNGFD